MQQSTLKYFSSWFFFIPISKITATHRSPRPLVPASFGQLFVAKLIRIGIIRDLLFGTLVINALFAIPIPLLLPTAKASSDELVEIDNKIKGQAEQLIPSTPERSEPESPLQTQRLELKLKDAVALALQNNRQLKNAYLERIIQRKDLEVAEDKFEPDFTPQIRVSVNRDRLGSTSTNTGELELTARVSVLFPTGGQLESGWTGAGRLQSASDSLSQNLSVNFKQPLLRGFGTEINNASIDIARLQENANILQLKSTLIDRITDTVITYRSLLQAQEGLKIQQLALESAKGQLEITQAFIDAGRLARIDLIPNQTAVANREVALLAAQNQLKEAQSRLLQILDIDRDLELIASETPTIKESPLLAPEELIQLALANNPRYLNSSINIQLAQFNLLLAEDRRRWDLNLDLNYTNNLNSISDSGADFKTALNLTREFGNLNLDGDVTRSGVRLQQVQNDLVEAKEDLEIQIQNRIREVNFRLTEVQQAKLATQLSQQQLQNEQEKLRLGRGNIIDIVRFENDLVNARDRELNAVIAYLNALTNLEQTVGTTLETWNVTIKDQ
jgi:outer membrane protein